MMPISGRGQSKIKGKKVDGGMMKFWKISQLITLVDVHAIIDRLQYKIHENTDLQ